MSYWVKERETVEETLPHLLLSYVMREPKCPELSSSVGDVASNIYDFFLSTLKHDFTEPIWPIMCPVSD